MSLILTSATASLLPGTGQPADESRVSISLTDPSTASAGTSGTRSALTSTFVTERQPRESEWSARSVLDFTDDGAKKSYQAQGLNQNEYKNYFGLAEGYNTDGIITAVRPGNFGSIAVTTPEQVVGVLPKDDTKVVWSEKPSKLQHPEFTDEFLFGKEFLDKMKAKQLQLSIPRKNVLADSEATIYDTDLVQQNGGSPSWTRQETSGLKKENEKVPDMIGKPKTKKATKYSSFKHSSSEIPEDLDKYHKFDPTHQKPTVKKSSLKYKEFSRGMKEHKTKSIVDHSEYRVPLGMNLKNSFHSGDYHVSGIGQNTPQKNHPSPHYDQNNHKHPGFYQNVPKEVVSNSVDGEFYGDAMSNDVQFHKISTNGYDHEVANMYQNNYMHHSESDIPDQEKMNNMEVGPKRIHGDLDSPRHENLYEHDHNTDFELNKGALFKSSSYGGKNNNNYGVVQTPYSSTYLKDSNLYTPTLNSNMSPRVRANESRNVRQITKDGLHNNPVHIPHTLSPGGKYIQNNDLIPFQDNSDGTPYDIKHRPKHVSLPKNHRFHQSVNVKNNDIKLVESEMEQHRAVNGGIPLHRINQQSGRDIYDYQRKPAHMKTNKNMKKSNFKQILGKSKLPPAYYKNHPGPPKHKVYQKINSEHHEGRNLHGVRLFPHEEQHHSSFALPVPYVGYPVYSSVNGVVHGSSDGESTLTSSIPVQKPFGHSGGSVGSYGKLHHKRYPKLSQQYRRGIANVLRQANHLAYPSNVPLYRNHLIDFGQNRSRHSTAYSKPHGNFRKHRGHVQSPGVHSNIIPPNQIPLNRSPNQILNLDSYMHRNHMNAIPPNRY